MDTPFDCEEFHKLCMDYRGASAGTPAHAAYERLQAYCRRQQNISYNEGWTDRGNSK